MDWTRANQQPHLEKDVFLLCTRTNSFMLHGFGTLVLGGLHTAKTEYSSQIGYVVTDWFPDKLDKIASIKELEGPASEVQS